MLVHQTCEKTTALGLPSNPGSDQRKCMALSQPASCAPQDACKIVKTTLTFDMMAVRMPTMF